MYIYWELYKFFNIGSLIAAVKSVTGETLELTGVLRQEMGMYLCIASNTVPPTVSKRYSVDVHCKYHVALRPLISRRSIVVAYISRSVRSNIILIAFCFRNCLTAFALSFRYSKHIPKKF